jgi:hypothetical protein
MLARLTPYTGLCGEEATKIVRDLNKKTRSADQEARNNDDPADDIMTTRGEAVKAAAKEKLAVARQLAQTLKFFIIRRSASSTDPDGQPLISLPRRTNITLRLHQNEIELARRDEVMKGVVAVK